MECATGTYSTSNGPSRTRPPAAISFNSTFGAPGSDKRLASKRPMAKRVA
jgi:hypothetical protein